MINPVKHVKAVYKSKHPVRKITELGYTEGYFMKKSPLAKDYIEQRETNFFQKISNLVKNAFTKTK